MDDKESVAQPINISTEPKDTLSEKSGAIKKCVEEYLKITCPKVAFVYTSPKVGSTALVSSFRIFASKKINIFHFHGNHLLPQEYKLAGVTINDLICYCDSVLKKRVYVIDVYRSPIEKKMSTFFDRLAVHHFNAPEKVVENIPMERIIRRFNDIFPYIGTEDYLMDYYDDRVRTALPSIFPHSKYHFTIDIGLVKYIKLRLMDSEHWGAILSSIFGIHLEVIVDYAAQSKALGNLYTRFKKQYKIPSQYLNELEKEDSNLKYYLSEKEREIYISRWKMKCDNDSSVLSFSKEQYDVYLRISSENSYLDIVQTNKEHYLDEGCICDTCMEKRNKLASAIILNPKLCNLEKIHHVPHKQPIQTIQTIMNNQQTIMNNPQTINDSHSHRSAHRYRKRGKSRSRSYSVRIKMVL